MRPSYPDEELCDDHVALAAGQVQRVASVSFPTGLVDLLPGPVGEQQDDGAEVLLGRGPQQLLAQRQVGARQRRHEQALLVLRPDPALPLLPDGPNTGTLLKHGQEAERVYSYKIKRPDPEENSFFK